MNMMETREEKERENGSSTRRYDHHRLRVYQQALAFLEWRGSALRRVPRSHDLAEQLTRAATSIVLNIAEACGELSGPERARFFRIARRSATECDAILDSLHVLGLEPEPSLAQGRALLTPVIAMLTVLCRPR